MHWINNYYDMYSSKYRKEQRNGRLTTAHRVQYYTMRQNGTIIVRYYHQTTPKLDKNKNAYINNYAWSLSTGVTGSKSV